GIAADLVGGVQAVGGTCIVDVFVDGTEGQIAQGVAHTGPNAGEVNEDGGGAVIISTVVLPGDAGLQRTFLVGEAEAGQIGGVIILTTGLVILHRGRVHGVELQPAGTVGSVHQHVLRANVPHVRVVDRAQDAAGVADGVTED